MPITVDWDSPSTAVATVSGSFSYMEMLQFVQTQWGSAVQAILLDATLGSAAALSADDVRRLAQTAASLHASGDLIAPLAIVTPHDRDFGLARMFQSWTEACGMRSVGVFRTNDAAREWLLMTTPQ